MGIGRTGSSVEAALNAAYLLSQGFEMLACYNLNGDGFSSLL